MFDKRGLRYHSPDHGITIIIPEDAVICEARLRVGVSFVGPFNIPKSYRPVSAVFWIDINAPLLKCAELHMHHFVRLQNPEDTKKLSFFVAADESFITTGEFQFTKVEKSHSSFSHERAYGTLWLDHFCTLCQLEELDESSLPLECRYYLTGVTPQNPEHFEGWQLDIVFSYALPTCFSVSACTTVLLLGCYLLMDNYHLSR